jgi:hypothetical protein
VANGAFVAAYGRAGRVVGALAVNTPCALDVYAALINSRGCFPPDLQAVHARYPDRVLDVALPADGQATHETPGHAQPGKPLAVGVPPVRWDVDHEWR